MSFGTNPHVVKARAAEQKAEDAEDSHARAMAHREAAHQWDRAVSREKPGKKRTEYEENAERNRVLAEAAEEANGTSEGASGGSSEPASGSAPGKAPTTRLLN